MSSGSPLATYFTMASSLILSKLTLVSRAAATVRPVSLSIRHWPVNTLWVAPERVNSMAAASAASAGLPKRASSSTTTVSAPKMRPGPLPLAFHSSAAVWAFRVAL